MPEADDIFLDIETNWEGRITVIGFSSESTGIVQLVGDDVSEMNLVRALPRAGRLFTYNGHCFDLPVIRRELFLDLRAMYDSHDLRFICQRHGLTGGQKLVEQRIGVKRALPDMDGRDALWLWHLYEHGDAAALETLLAYNAEDVRGLEAIWSYCMNDLNIGEI